MPQRYLLCILTPLLLLSCGAGAQEQAPYSEAEFRVPTDPMQVVLHVTFAPSLQSGQDNLPVISATLYGSGRLELSHSQDGEFTRQLTDSEIHSLIQHAVSHGLIEYESWAIRAKIDTPTSGYGNSTVMVLLAVDNYRRGSHDWASKEKIIRAKDPVLAAEQYPQIPEFQALRFLTEWTTEMVIAAKSESSSAARKPVPFSEAEFSIPTDPTQAILQITSSSMEMSVWSATIYGDGRLSLQDGAKEFSRQLEFSEVQLLMERAVSQGLVEYDPLAILAKKLTVLKGQRPPLSVDGGTTTILLRVDNYARGGFEQPHAEKVIQIDDLHLAMRHFPEIPEFQGIAYLVTWASNEFKAAKEET